MPRTLSSDVTTKKESISICRFTVLQHLRIYNGGVPLRVLKAANAVESAVLSGSAEWYSCGLLHYAEDSARYSQKNSDELRAGFGNSCSSWPDGAACGLD